MWWQLSPQLLTVDVSRDLSGSCDCHLWLSTVQNLSQISQCHCLFHLLFLLWMSFTDSRRSCIRHLIAVFMQSQRPMSSSEGEAAPAGPVQEPSDRWLGAKGPGHINVAVQYTVSGDGDISSSWEVDTSKAIPSKLPMFMYRCRDICC